MTLQISAIHEQTSAARDFAVRSFVRACWQGFMAATAMGYRPSKRKNLHGFIPA
jgi:hypothetical protein